MKVVCQDARTFRLEDHESDATNAVGFPRSPTANYFSDDCQGVGGADLITMSYSLSMIVSRKQAVAEICLTFAAGLLLRH